MNFLGITLFLLSAACFGLGLLFDYTEYRYGKPPRLALRWEFLGTLAAIPLMIAAVAAALYAHYRG